MDGIINTSRCCSRIIRHVRHFAVGRHRLGGSQLPAARIATPAAQTYHSRIACVAPLRHSFVGLGRRYMSSYENSANPLVLPTELHDPLMEYARQLAAQSKTLEQWAEVEVPSAARQRSNFSKTRRFLTGVVARLDEYDKVLQQIEELKEMLKEPDLKAMATTEIKECHDNLVEIMNSLAGQVFPAEEIEDRNCIMEIRSGVGGSEAASFAMELFRMFENFVRYKGGRFEITNIVPCTEDGYREASAFITGKSLFGALRFESGVHRVQRVPKSDAMGRRHTSTVAILILPEPTELDIVIDAKDLKYEVFRASGAGGQHVQKTESAVRVTHIPSGIAFRSETSRVQSVNRENCLKLLRAKLFDIESSKKEQDEQEHRKSIVGKMDFSEKVRTFHYFGMQVVDHRFDLKTTGLTAVLNNAADTAAFLEKVATSAKISAIRKALRASPPDHISEFKPKTLHAAESP
ncbi:peptide chain release factor 1-like isoform X2 [Sycon ciliatum]|uniref:peptide chain release factor 1-like isoform X2 n=2 Tax=Sycon ciliatum TaxID=27933 RepID=UPI0031F6F0D9